MDIPADIEVSDHYRIFADPTSKTLNDNIKNTTCPLGDGRHLDRPSYGLGDLDKFPVELQAIILVQLDLKTLMNFRHVIRQAMEVVDALPEYKSILKQIPAPLRAMFSVDLGEFIACHKLYDTLRTANCEGCRQSAQFICLLKCCRICMECLCCRAKWSPITNYDAARLYAVPDKRLLELRSIASRYIFYRRNNGPNS